MKAAAAPTKAMEVIKKEKAIKAMKAAAPAKAFKPGHLCNSVETSFDKCQGGV